MDIMKTKILNVYNVPLSVVPVKIALITVKPVIPKLYIEVNNYLVNVFLAILKMIKESVKFVVINVTNAKIILIIVQFVL